MLKQRNARGERRRYNALLLGATVMVVAIILLRRNRMK
jgi:hypothetical protein